MTTFDFQTQKAIGEAGEAALDAHFSRWFDITPATGLQQRLGIDRMFKAKSDGSVLTVEYKTDHRAHQTGMAFVELSTFPDQPRSGWAYTCAADWIVYYVPGTDSEQAYIIRPAMLRAALPDWLKHYRQVSVRNAGYQTVGLLVPLRELERIALQVVSVE